MVLHSYHDDFNPSEPRGQTIMRITPQKSDARHSLHHSCMIGFYKSQRTVNGDFFIDSITSELNEYKERSGLMFGVSFTGTLSFQGACSQLQEKPALST